jgi:hypothetical protein
MIGLKETAFQFANAALPISVKKAQKIPVNPFWHLTPPRPIHEPRIAAYAKARMRNQILLGVRPLASE